MKYSYWQKRQRNDFTRILILLVDACVINTDMKYYFYNVQINQKRNEIDLTFWFIECIEILILHKVSQSLWIFWHVNVYCEDIFWLYGMPVHRSIGRNMFLRTVASFLVIGEKFDLTSVLIGLVALSVGSLYFQMTI